jgi:hypothetical protein
MSPKTQKNTSSLSSLNSLLMAIAFILLFLAAGVVAFLQGRPAPQQDPLYENAVLVTPSPSP